MTPPYTATQRPFPSGPTSSRPIGLLSWHLGHGESLSLFFFGGEPVYRLRVPLSLCQSSSRCHPERSEGSQLLPHPRVIARQGTRQNAHFAQFWCNITPFRIQKTKNFNPLWNENRPGGGGVLTLGSSLDGNSPGRQS